MRVKRVFDLKLLARLAVCGAAALMLGACGGIIPASAPPTTIGASSQTIQVGTGRDYPPATRADVEGSRDTSSRQSVGMASAPMSYAAHPNDRSCLADLNAAGARFNPIPDTYAAPGCNKLGTVQLSALSGDTSKFGVSNLGPVKCGTAKAFSAWARYGVDRAARQILGSSLARIETMGSYACRNIAGSSRRSAHATGNAIDVSGFVLADGRHIDLKSDWDGGTPAEREFLRIVHKSACKRFGTVLGPEYNAAHNDHFHLEGTGNSFCR
ncbi:MAG: extensin family protein [Pseudomonadota bacterium]